MFWDFINKNFMGSSLQKVFSCLATFHCVTIDKRLQLVISLYVQASQEVNSLQLFSPNGITQVFGRIMWYETHKTFLKSNRL